MSRLSLTPSNAVPCCFCFPELQLVHELDTAELSSPKAECLRLELDAEAVEGMGMGIVVDAEGSVTSMLM